MPNGFVPNKNFKRELEHQTAYVQGLAEVTKPAEMNAKNFAPVDEGDYRDSIGVAIVDNKVYLRATDFKAGWIEYGTVDTPIFAPLRKGVRAAGLRFNESSK